MEPGFGSQHVHWDLGAGGPMGSEAGPSSWDGNLSYQRGALDEEEEDMYALAKAQFDHHQLERCAWILDQGNCRSDKSLFLKLYARFLVSSLCICGA